jgi:hypothetical protein
VERCFRTVKESFETLFHFHTPKTVAEANQWLFKHLLHYNSQPHPMQAGSRIEVWACDLPAAGFHRMCAWDTFCTFAREPEFRTVGLDGRISLENRIDQVTPELSGERVEVWKGVFDLGVYVQDQGGAIHGPMRRDQAPSRLGLTGAGGRRSGIGAWRRWSTWPRGYPSGAPRCPGTGGRQRNAAARLTSLRSRLPTPSVSCRSNTPR